MDELIKALELSVASKNWYGALFIALSIPDICGYLESPTVGSQTRYEQWFAKYMLPKYSRGPREDIAPQIFLSPSDCYALRCALLHQGSEEITGQSARKALDRFRFIEPPPSGQIHCNRIRDVLQLQVDIFCNDVLSGLRKWLQDIQGNSSIEQCIGNILKIYPNNQIPSLLRIGK
jgi:hypothetical protein